MEMAAGDAGSPGFAGLDKNQKKPSARRPSNEEEEMREARASVCPTRR